MSKANESTGLIEPQMALTVPEKPSTPMEMLALAVSQNADIEKLSKLMDLQERWEKNEARKAFVTALNAFKANPPKIQKNKHVVFETSKGTVEYWHATLDHVCDQITQGLGRHGLTHRWKLDQTDQLIKVTCVLTHELGHSEETSLSGGPDTTGTKNPVQAISSTVTYLQRYTLLAACGLAAENTDNDGAGATNGELTEQIEWLQNASSKEELLRLFRQAYAQFETNPAALRALVKAKEAKKGQL